MVINTVDRVTGEGGRLPATYVNDFLAILTPRTPTISITEGANRVTKGKLKVNNTALS